MRSKIGANVYEAIKDTFLQKHLTSFASAYKQKKLCAYENLDFKNLQRQLKRQSKAVRLLKKQRYPDRLTGK